MYFIGRHLVQSSMEKGALFYFKRFDIMGIWRDNLESLKHLLAKYDDLEDGINITDVISFDLLSYLDSWICISKESPTVLNSPLTRNDLTNICTYIYIMPFKFLI